MEWHFAPNDKPKRTTECYVKLLSYPVFKVGEEIHVAGDGTLINDVVMYFSEDGIKGEPGVDEEGFYELTPFVDNSGRILWYYTRIDDELIVHWAEAYTSKITKLGAEQIYERFHK